MRVFLHNKNIPRYFEYMYFSEGQKTEGSDAEAAASGDGMSECYELRGRLT